MTKHPYYNFDKLMSFNAVYNFLVGGRGLGKTFGAKVKAIKAALTKGDQFIYLRRYKTELTTSRNTFFADIIAVGLFKDYDFRINGPVAQASKVSERENGKQREWITLGYFIALSTSQSQKSVAFPLVKTIIFDEFIIEKGSLQYLPDESTVFNNFFSTVDRWMDKTRVFFLANSVTIMNPYFIKYEIMPDENSEFISRGGGFLIAHFPDSKDFQSSVNNTRFGKFIAGSEYADYAVGNNFADNHGSLLDDKKSKATYLFTLETKNGSFSVWSDNSRNEYFVQEKLPKSQVLYTLLPERMDIDKILMTFTDKPLAYLRAAFRAGRVTFDKPATRNNFIEIAKR